MVDRLLPKDIDCEEALLGSLLIDGLAIQKIINQISASDFFSERNSWIYASCVDIFNRLEAINQISVAQDLSRLEKLMACGGPAYLSHLISICPTSLDIENYANIVYRLSVSRKLVLLSEKVASIGYQALPDVNETINNAKKLVDEFGKSSLVLSNSVITPIKAANEIWDLWSKNKEPQKMPSWGFLDLDNITAGIYPEYVIVAGRTSMGKSQLALDVAESLVAQDVPVLYASAEMSSVQIYERKLARLLGISILDIRKYGFQPDHEPFILNLVGEMSESKINYMTGKLYLRDIYREIDAILSKGKLGCVFIDYIGALQDCYDAGRENQNVKVSKVSNQIQAMVHEFNIPIVALAQLNREIEKRADPIPQLSDLRDSGSLEQDADVIFLGHRAKLETGGLSNVMDLTMAKNRQLGAQPPIKLLFKTDARRYVDFTEQYQDNVPVQGGLE
jgi:replicative DNA helicase